MHSIVKIHTQTHTHLFSLLSHSLFLFFSQTIFLYFASLYSSLNLCDPVRFSSFFPSCTLFSSTRLPPLRMSIPVKIYGRKIEGPSMATIQPSIYLPHSSEDTFGVYVSGRVGARHKTMSRS